MSGRAVATTATTLPLEALWGQRSRARVDWAFRAHERFVQSLSDEVRSRLTCKDAQDEAYVVVFGKTQVGKTTLLMDLMGVTPEAMGRVSRVLRGGRPMGQSATATTMEYRRSPDQRWGLTTNQTRWFTTDDEATRALGELRGQMESGRLNLTAPCVVSIPLDRFGPDDGQPRVRMLDLPGDKPANTVEQAHVHAMAKQYVPLADLILLVGRGDDLSFLQPGELTLPGIEDWQSVPGRFRIVTTYSFTAQSVRELVRKTKEPLTARFFRKRLMGEIEKFSPLTQEARQERLFFPLEFGQSWLDAQSYQLELYERVSPIIAELKQQLHADIQASTTPMARLRSAVDAHVVVTRVKENRLWDMEREDARLQKVLLRARDSEEQTGLTAKEAQRAWQDLQKKLSVLTDERLKKDLREHYRLNGSTHAGDPDESVNGFKSCIYQAVDSLLNRLTESRPQGLPSDTAWFWRQVKMSEHRDQAWHKLNDKFDAFRDHLNAYTLDTYWFTSSSDSDYQKDRRALRHHIESAEETLTENARGWWLLAARERRNAQSDELKRLEHEHALWTDRLKEAVSQVSQAEAACEEQRRLRVAFVQRMDADLVESRRFMVLLDEAYLEELRQRRQRMSQHGSATHTFLELLAAVQLGQARQQLLMQVEPEEAVA